MVFFLVFTKKILKTNSDPLSWIFFLKKLKFENVKKNICKQDGKYYSKIKQKRMQIYTKVNIK